MLSVEIYAVICQFGQCYALCSASDLPAHQSAGAGHHQDGKTRPGGPPRREKAFRSRQAASTHMTTLSPTDGRIQMKQDSPVPAGCSENPVHTKNGNGVSEEDQRSSGASDCRDTRWSSSCPTSVSSYSSHFVPACGHFQLFLINSSFTV